MAKVTIRPANEEAQEKTAYAPGLGKKGEERRPGTTPETLRRRMSDLLADEFSRVGEELYAQAISAVKKDVEEVFKKGVSDLSAVIKKKLGELGFEEATKHFRPWLEGIVGDLRTEGMQTIGDSLDSIATEFSVQLSEGEDLLGIPGEEAPAAAPPEESAPAPAPAEPAEPAAAEEEGVPTVTDEEIEAMLSGKEVPAEQPAAAATTAGDLKRTFRQRRKQRQVIARPTKSELLSSAAERLKILEDK